MILSSFHRLHRLLRGPGVTLSASAAAVLLASSLQAKPVPSNLGNGLDKLVASHVALAQAKTNGVALRGTVNVNGKTYVDETAAAIATSALGSTDGRLLVRITLNGTVSIADLKKAVESRASTLEVTAMDTAYRGVGVMNALVDVSQVAKLAGTPGVGAVVLELKPRHARAPLAVTATPAAAPALGPVVSAPPTGVPVNPAATENAYPGASVGEVINKVGTTFDQGVTQHRVDQVSRFFNSAAPAGPLDQPGAGMQIACLSNSFAANAAHPASVDVNNNDLPGSASATNTTPTFVLQDDLNSSTSDDEGRGMVQILYKMAPYAKLGFATADTGEVGFANNIRGLGGLAGYTISGQTYAADVICDDVGYFDEPFFQDGIISAGIEDVAAAGISYFSSAANDIGTNGYDSDTRWVPAGTGVTAAAGNTSLAGTNIDLTGVPPALYAGGFHNFNPNGLDVAQLVNIAANNTVYTQFQWNDPYDQASAVAVTGTLLDTNGTYVATDLTYNVPGNITAGTSYQVVETAINRSTFDGIITVYKSDGTTVIAGPQDTGTDEVVRFKAPANDTGFVVKVGHFSTTTGDFNLKVQSFSGFAGPLVSTSLSVLAFNVTTGAYVPASSLTTDATATNQPIQLGFTNRTSAAVPQIQFVIARSTVPAAGNQYPTHIRYLLGGNGRAGYGPAEYFTYNTVTTAGHAMSPNCNGTAAYSVFRPSLPETFTAPGPVTIYFDRAGNRLATPEVRLKPEIGAADGANISANESLAGLGSDSTSDPDATQGQFFGTSAAAPHAAAIAGLVLQNKGGRRSVTPAQMTNLLRRSTFLHDLDPNFSSGSARVFGGAGGKVTISINSDGSTGGALTGTGLADTTAFSVAYVGGSSITSLVFNQNGTTANGGVSGGNNGVTYNQAEATANGTVTYFENSLPGVIFRPGDKAFTLNTTLPDSVAGATAAYSNLTTGNTNQYLTATITIPGGNFPSSKLLRFTVGRGLAFSSSTGNGLNVVVNSTTGTTYTSADIFGGGVSLPNAQVNLQGMPFSGTTADGGTFSGVIVNRIGGGWSKTDGYGFINAQTAVTQTVQ